MYNFAASRHPGEITTDRVIFLSWDSFQPSASQTLQRSIIVALKRSVLCRDVVVRVRYIGGIIMTSKLARWRLKSPASRLFPKSFIQGADQRKHQSSASLVFVRGIRPRPVNSPHKGTVTRKMFPFDDFITESKQIRRSYSASLPTIWCCELCHWSIKYFYNSFDCV